MTISKNYFRLFDKDEDGKLSVDEMREIMVNLGEGPISETEFSVFIKENFILFAQFSAPIHIVMMKTLDIINFFIAVLSKR